MIIIFIFYILLQLYRLDSTPPHWLDEANHINTAYNILHNHIYFCDFFKNRFEGVSFNGMPLQLVLMAGYLNITDSLFGLRLLYVIYSTITLFFTYLISKSRLVVILLASSFLFFSMSRQVMPQVLSCMFSVIAYYFYTKKRYFVSGLTASLSFLSHPTGIGIILALLIMRLKNE